MINVLYIDDDENNLISFKSIFRSKYDVLTTSSVEQFLEYVSNNNINVVIVDQKMPKISGIDLIARVKEIDDTIVAILTSAYFNNNSYDNSGNLIFKFLEKPWDVDLLDESIRQSYELFKMKRKNRSVIADLIALVNKQHHLIKTTVSRLKDIIVHREKSNFLFKDIYEEVYHFYEVHFIVEEALMKVIKNENDDHISEHRYFLLNMPNINSSVDLLIFIDKWNKNHVNNYDNQLVPSEVKEMVYDFED